MKKLTARQREVLDFIINIVEEESIPPTVAEITTGLGLKSTNGVRGHLQALARKGAIDLIPNASRGIRIRDYEFSSAVENEEQGLPVVGRVAAGEPILAIEHIENYYQIDATGFSPHADYLLQVRGMSMREIGILDGDLVAVHRASTAENGQVVVARLDDEVTVKRLKKRNNIAYLIAENPDFEPIRVDFRKQELVIEGIVVGVLRYM